MERGPRSPSCTHRGSRSAPALRSPPPCPEHPLPFCSSDTEGSVASQLLLRHEQHYYPLNLVVVSAAKTDVRKETRTGAGVVLETTQTPRCPGKGSQPGLQSNELGLA